MKKQIIFFLSALSGFFIGVFITGKVENKARKKIQIISDKHLALFLMMNRWVQAKQEGKNVSDFLEHNAYKNIAIYGMSYVGECLLKELKDTQTVVKYGIDQRSDELYSEVSIYSPDDNLEDVDAIIVTSIFFVDVIREKLSLKVSCPIISLENILNEI